MAGQVLGAAVDHNIRSQGQRPLEIGGQEGIVHNHQDPVFVGQFADGFQVRDFHGGVGGSFQIDGFGGGGDGLFHGLQITGVDGGEGQAQGLIGGPEQPEGPAVQVETGDQVVSRGKKPHHRINGCHAGGKAQGIGAPFQGGQDFFQSGVGGVGFPGIGPAGGFPQAGMGKSGCEIQSRRDGAGGIVGAASVDTGSGEFHDFFPPCRAQGANNAYYLYRNTLPVPGNFVKGPERAWRQGKTGKMVF